MPKFPELFGDPNNPAGRWNRRPAIAIVVLEHEADVFPSPEAAIEARVGSWIMEEDSVLGKPHAVNGSVGRGAEGWVPVIEWLGSAGGAGIVGGAAWAAVANIVRRLRAQWEQGEERPFRFYISRGTAAAIAADEISEKFGEEGPLEIEAVEEPSGIAGQDPIEISYVGLEPWVVLLRSIERKRRYYVIVAPDGEILGRIETPLLEWEEMFLQPGGFAEDQPGRK
jgi:hypothetical protein